MPDALDKVTEKIRESVRKLGHSGYHRRLLRRVKDFVPDAVNALGKPGVVVQGVSLVQAPFQEFGLVNGNQSSCCLGTSEAASQDSTCSLRR